jgi:hypothetical protein
MWGEAFDLAGCDPVAGDTANAFLDGQGHAAISAAQRPLGLQPANVRDLDHGGGRQLGWPARCLDPIPGDDASRLVPMGPSDDIFVELQHEMPAVSRKYHMARRGISASKMAWGGSGK